MERWGDAEIDREIAEQHGLAGELVASVKRLPPEVEPRHDSARRLVQALDPTPSEIRSLAAKLKPSDHEPRRLRRQSNRKRRTIQIKTYRLIARFSVLWTVSKTIHFCKEVALFALDVAELSSEATRRTWKWLSARFSAMRQRWRDLISRKRQR